MCTGKWLAQDERLSERMHLERKRGVQDCISRDRHVQMAKWSVIRPEESYGVYLSGNDQGLEGNDASTGGQRRTGYLDKRFATRFFHLDEAIGRRDHPHPDK